jgi:hypothetical protein
VATQRKWGSQVFGLSRRAATTSGQNLSDSLVTRLSERFPRAIKSNVSLGNSFADLVVESPGRIVVAEFKTGDPELPLPSSTIPQMGFFVEQAHSRYPGCEIVPIVVTNYAVSESDKKALGKEGVKILSVASGSIDMIVADFLQQTGIPQEEAEAGAEA